MSAQSYEDEAFRALKAGRKADAIRTLRAGAKISFGRGRAARMRDWADALEEGVPGFECKPEDTCFFDMETRYFREKDGVA